MEKSVENVERQAGDVDATDLMPVCENRAKQHKHIEPLNVPSRGQIKAGEAIWEWEHGHGYTSTSAGEAN